MSEIVDHIIGSAVGITPDGQTVQLRVVGSNCDERKIATVQLDRVITRTARILARIITENSIPLFRHDRRIVGVDTKAAKMVPLGHVEAASWFERRGIFFDKWSRDQYLTETLSETQSKALLAALVEDLRPLARVMPVETPWLNNGKLELQPGGYNEKTETLTAKTVEYADKSMSIDAAKEIFTIAFADVAWPSNKEEKARALSVLIAAMLTPYLSCYFAPSVRRPGFLFTANEVGAGKTTLLYFALTTIFGSPIQTTAPPAKNDDANVSKLLDSVVQSGRAYLAFDNWDRKVDSGPMAQLITANAMTGRVLGGSSMFDAVVRCLVYITATTKNFSAEMRRRLLTVDLYVEQARAEDRKIKRPLDESDVAEMRPELLSALWAYVRCWHEAGCPPGNVSHVSFPEWGRVVGGVLEHAGHVSPLLPSRRVVDPKLDRFMHLVATVVESMDADHKNEKRIGPGDLMEIARKAGKFEGILDPEGPSEKAAKSEQQKFRYQCETYEEGRTFQVEDGRQIRFISEGEGHSKKYVFTVL